MKASTVLRKALEKYVLSHDSFMCSVVEDMREEGYTSSDVAPALSAIKLALDRNFTLTGMLRENDSAYRAFVMVDGRNKWNTREAADYRIEWWLRLIEKLETNGE